MTTSAEARPITTAALANAAFGDDPGRWPLPAATTPYELWLRAVVAGGQGRYGSALADLATLRRGPRGPLVSLAHSTRASFLRQLGWHEPARTWDGRASALAGADPEAGADALIGLAADALGVGRFAASGRALSRAADLLTEPCACATACADGVGVRGTGDGPRAGFGGRGTRRRGRSQGRSIRFGAPHGEIRGRAGGRTVLRR